MPIDWIDFAHALARAFLYGLAAVLGLLLAGLIVWRAVETAICARRRSLVDRYRPAIDALLDPNGPATAVAALAAGPQRHRTLTADLLLDALRPMAGTDVARLADAAASLGMPERWAREVDDRRWWVRAKAIRGLGFIQARGELERVVARLDDAHEEVRAAAVDALGRLGDERAIPALIARLHDESRHQRTRVVDAVRMLGPSVAPALIGHAKAHPLHTSSVIEVLGVSGAAGAVDTLVGWSGDGDPEVRAAALRAIGSIGLDERSFYYMLRGLEDPHASVRAMAARALGRSGRVMAAPYLQSHLGDEWLVAAHAATGLRRLGPAGRTALEAHAPDAGQSGVLARQMLWELDRGRGTR